MYVRYHYFTIAIFSSCVISSIFLGFGPKRPPTVVFNGGNKAVELNIVTV